jgi:hypothetical protein
VREPSYMTRQEYELTEVALEPPDVPAEALALLSAWIEGECLLVDDREGVGGINFCRMDTKIMAPLPHIVASFSPAVPTSAKLGTTPTGTASICSSTGMWRKAGSWCGYKGTPPTLSLSRCSQPEARR